jgi:aryl-alcohol dehydrogenase-like predicted oxidoreductase
MVEHSTRNTLPQRRLGSRSIGCIGLGCVPGSGYYGAADVSEMEDVIRSALDLGVNLIDTADNYALGENERLIGRAIRGRRDDAVIASKGGLDPAVATAVESVEHDRTALDLRTFGLRPNGRAEHLREAIEGSLRRLGVEAVDIYYLHRLDPEVPIEESVGAMGEFVAEGKARAIGLCEVPVEILERARRVHPIASVQSEMSLWTRKPLEAVVPWCEQHGATFVPYAPLGRGYLTGKVASDSSFQPTDFRGDNPRFQPEAMRANQALVEVVEGVAGRHEATSAQIALAWLLHQSQNIVPIPGMERLKYLVENVDAASVELTEADLSELDRLPEAVGERYAEAVIKPED